MRVRAATEADVPAILPMVRGITQLHASQDPERFKVRPDVLDRYARWLPERARDPRSVLLVADVAEVRGGGRARTMDGAGATDTSAELAGFLVGTVEPEVPIFWIPECGWVHDVWVEPGHRRLGVATALVDEACARFATLGVRQVRLHTGSFNDAARAAFARSGFRPCVVEMLKPLS